MLKVLAFLLILVILFGVEATRAIIFGSFSAIVLAFLGLLGFCFLVYALNALGGKTDNKEQKAEEKPVEQKKAPLDAKTKKLAIWCQAIFVIVAIIIIVTLAVGMFLIS